METTTKSVASKVKVASTPKRKSVPTSTAKPKATVAKKVVTTRNKKQDIKPEEKKVLDTKNLKDTIKIAVVSQREVKYKYPEDVNGPIDRKAWRSAQRIKMTKLQAAITTSADDKAKKSAEKALADFRKEVLLVP